jgi:membrane protein
MTVLRRALQEARDDDVPIIAQALAYSLFLAIPATALVVLGVFSIVADPETIEDVVDRAQGVMPEEALSLVRDSLRRSSDSTGGGILMTVVGLALAVWTTTSAAATLMSGITRAYDRDDERGFVRKRLIALLVVLALVASGALVIGFLVLGPHLQRWIGSALDAERVTAWTWWTAQWPILIGALLFAFAVVLYLGPDAEQPTWKLITPGAVVAVLVWLAASGGFAFYAANFGSYEKSWGSLSAVVVTLVWLWLTSASLLLGAEINAEAQRVAEEEARVEKETERGATLAATPR